MESFSALGGTHTKSWGTPAYRAVPVPTALRRGQAFILGLVVLAVERKLIEIEPSAAAAALACRFVPGAVDQNPPHGFGRRREEMAATIPTLSVVRADQPQVRLVNQRRGLQRLAWLLPRKPLGRQMAQLVVDQRGGLEPPSTPPVQDALRSIIITAQGIIDRITAFLGDGPPPAPLSSTAVVPAAIHGAVMGGNAAPAARRLQAINQILGVADDRLQMVLQQLAPPTPPIAPLSRTRCAASATEPFSSSTAPGCSCRVLHRRLPWAGRSP